MRKPISREVYTLTQIENELFLRDEPFLRFWYKGVMQVIQTRSVAALLDQPQWASSRWEFVLETSEWIPLFNFAADNTVKIEDLVEIVDDLDPYREHRDTFLVYPKGAEGFVMYKEVEVDGQPRVAFVNAAQPYSLENSHPLPVFNAEGVRIRA